MADVAEKIDLVPVSSSLFTAVGYHADKRILALQFTSGSIRHVADMSTVSAEHFLADPSLGQHFNKHIKNKFQSQEMTGPCPNCGAQHGWIGETCADCGTTEYAVRAPKEATVAS